MQTILNEAKKLVTPSEQEQSNLDSIVKEVIAKVNKIAKPRAKLFVGGSVAKGSWLPGLHDIDFFLRFDYDKYKNQSDKISDYTEKIIFKCFDGVTRLHGSRDYFQFKYRGYEIEIVPALHITRPSQAKNITDVSPLHVNWVASHVKRKSGEARLAKKFFKGAGVYGAESFIHGFSGHVIEILTLKYGSFTNLLRATKDWKEKDFIDPAHHYKSAKQALEKMNSSKLEGPLIVVDPVQPERNAAAALNKENFLNLKKACAGFLKKPSLKFFEEKLLTMDDLKRYSKGKKLIIFSAEPDVDKIDIAGSRILKKFQIIKRILIKNGFKILNCRWQWDKENPALIWFYLEPQILSKTYRHGGPPADAKQFCSAFKCKYRKYQVKEMLGKLYVDLPRKYRKIDELLQDLSIDGVTLLD